MAVAQISDDLDKVEYQGLSTDTKPTLIESQTGSEFLELDTGAVDLNKGDVIRVAVRHSNGSAANLTVQNGNLLCFKI